ncbi:acyltransferase family protein [Tsuneonella rigui]|uniref:acyltransferase family protein n=1 Tax=Tsuneonella rigui TaxID=1708790 RepID=UPI000F7DE089|nr:acyltransferase [Tsuneonella rigui]
MPASETPRVAAIQALRGLAALTVAAVHFVSGFLHYIDGRTFIPVGLSEQTASAAVALFFMISGCVMVLSTRMLFGSWRGAGTFWRRRLVRVVPPYWIASGLFALVALWTGLPFEWTGFWHSLVFWIRPAAGASSVPFSLFLWPGWTLFYELMFYALFGAALVLGQRRAVIAATLVIVVAVMAGQIAPPDTLFLFAITRPVALLFIPGMLFGIWLSARRTVPAALRWLALAGVPFAFALLPAPSPDAPLGFGYVAWAGLPALLVMVAAVGGPLRLAGVRAATVMGDASYAIYLLHVPFAHAFMEVFNRDLSHPGGSLAGLVIGLPLLIALSAAFYHAVERPLTARLNHLGGDHRPARADLPHTLAP